MGNLKFLRENRDFGLFWAGALLVNLAVQIEAVTIGWQVYSIARQTMEMDRAAFQVGMVGLAQFLPMMALTLWAGSLVDRNSRRTIVLAALMVEALSVLALAVIALQPQPSLLWIFAVAAAFGASRAFLSPAVSAMTPMLVSVEDMPRAISLKSLAWQAAVIIGPWIGGLLLVLSPAAAYGAAAVLFVTGIGLTLMVRTNTRPLPQPGRVWAQIKEGLAYTWTNKVVFGSISLDLFAVLLGGATALLPAFASDILGVGPSGFGFLRSGPAVGALLVALYLSRWPITRHAGAKMFWAVGLFGAATVVFGLSTNIWLSVAALAILGGADMISVFVRQTLVQVVTPDHMRGRVASVSGLFISGSNELGEFQSGVAARLVGPVMACVLGGIGAMGVTGLCAWAFPDLRRADRLDGKD
jgi:MFS family permease